MSRAPHIPPRPYLPPTVYMLLVVLTTEALIAYGANPYILLVLLGLLLLITILCFIWARRTVALCLVCLVAGLVAAGSSQITHMQLAERVRVLQKTPISRLQFRIDSDPYQTDRGVRCKATIIAHELTGTQVWLSLPQDSVSSQRGDASISVPGRGDTLRGVGRFKIPANPSYATQLRAQGIAGTVSISHVQEVSASDSPVDIYREFLLSSIEPDASPERALLAGALCGYRSSIKTFGVDEELAICGLAHLVAVSGSHLSVVAALCTQVLSPLNLGVRPRFAIVAIVSLLFVMLCGFPASALRAWIMALSSSAAHLVGRRAHSISAVCFVAMLMALVQPFCIGDLAYLLSVTSVLGLCIFSRYAGYVLEVLIKPHFAPRFLPTAVRKVWRTVQTHVRASLASSVVAQVTTAPFCIPVFGRWSAVAPLSNAVLGPCFTLVLGCGCLALLLRWVPVVSSLLMSITLFWCKLILWIARLLTLIPGASWALDPQNIMPSLVSLSCLLLVLIWWPRLDRRVLLGTVTMVLTGMLSLWLWWGPLAPPRFVMLDVGQGDALLIKDGNQSVLIDTGPEPEELLSALVRNHVSTLDTLILTHLHADHAAGTQALCDNFAVKKLVVAEGISDESIGKLFSASPRFGVPETVHVLQGSNLQTQHFNLEVLWPASAVDGTKNEDSLVIRVTYESSGATTPPSILLTGDAEQDVLGALAEKNMLAATDVLKVGHHGSEVSLNTELAQILRPRVAVISVGRENKYGHPTKTCLELLHEVGAQVFCTMDYGDIALEIEASGEVRVFTQRERAPPFDSVWAMIVS